LNIGSGDDDPGLGIELAEFGKDFQAVHALHDHVEHDEVGLVQEVAFEGVMAVFGFLDGVPPGFQ
jgi:hypothetical protein